MAQRDIKIAFLDKKFKISVSAANEVDRTIWVNGSEARFLFNALDALINTRPRSEDDRLSMENEKNMGEAIKAESL